MACRACSICPGSAETSSDQSETFKMFGVVKPGSHERHKHKQRKQRMNSPLRLAKTKQREFFFVSPFFLLFAYAWTMILCLWRSLCRRLDLIPLFCLLFCPYAYAIVWTRLKEESKIRPFPPLFFALWSFVVWRAPLLWMHLGRWESNRKSRVALGCLGYRLDSVCLSMFVCRHTARRTQYNLVSRPSYSRVGLAKLKIYGRLYMKTSELLNMNAFKIFSRDFHHVSPLQCNVLIKVRVQV